MGIPSNGGLGPYQLAIIFGLSLYGIGGKFSIAGPFDTEASTFAMVVWATQAALLILLGIFTAIYIAVDRYRIKTGRVTVITNGSGMKL